jgi:hypothetical protein
LLEIADARYISTGRIINPHRLDMSRKPPGYTVGYGRPPLHSRFRKGRSGNPQGGRRPAKLLAMMLQEALDRPVAQRGLRVGARRRAGRRTTRREAIIASLVEKSAAGDLPATKLLLDLVLKTELAAGPAPLPGAENDEEDPREFLLRELARLSAAGAADDNGYAIRKPAP